MKIKNMRVFIASILTFAIIGTFRGCEEYKLKHESKIGNITESVEEIKFEDIFTPVEEDIKIEEEPEIITKKAK